MLKSSTMSGQLDIYSHAYSWLDIPPVEASGGQDQYYIRSPLHLLYRTEMAAINFFAYGLSHFSAIFT